MAFFPLMLITANLWMLNKFIKKKKSSFVCSNLKMIFFFCCRKPDSRKMKSRKLCWAPNSRKIQRKNLDKLLHSVWMNAACSRLRLAICIELNFGFQLIKSRVAQVIFNCMIVVSVVFLLLCSSQACYTGWPSADYAHPGNKWMCLLYSIPYFGFLHLLPPAFSHCFRHHIVNRWFTSLFRTNVVQIVFFKHRLRKEKKNTHTNLLSIWRAFYRRSALHQDTGKLKTSSKIKIHCLVVHFVEFQAQANQFQGMI